MNSLLKSFIDQNGRQSQFCIIPNKNIFGFMGGKKAIWGCNFVLMENGIGFFPNIRTQKNKKNETKKKAII